MRQHLIQERIQLLRSYSSRMLSQTRLLQYKKIDFLIIFFVVVDEKISLIFSKFWFEYDGWDGASPRAAIAKRSVLNILNVSIKKEKKNKKQWVPKEQVLFSFFLFFLVLLLLFSSSRCFFFFPFFCSFLILQDRRRRRSREKEEEEKKEPDYKKKRTRRHTQKFHWTYPVAPKHRSLAEEAAAAH